MEKWNGGRHRVVSGSETDTSDYNVVGSNPDKLVKLLRKRVFNIHIAVDAAYAAGLTVEVGKGRHHKTFLIAQDGNKLPLMDHRRDYPPRITRNIKKFILDHGEFGQDTEE